ncbi:MAG TPA: hypothetical protein VG983_00210 [Caulobacterales bacterium]|jgi:hypothetical protein|nr:hypothetical protein [Caulobacterales bacterium]
MKRFAALLLPAFALGLAACADYGYDSYGYDTAYYDGYYDNYYGPIYGGYWGPGAVFYYSTGPNRAYVPDRGRHFRRGEFPGSHRFHMPNRGHDDHRPHGDHDWRDHR